LGNTAWTITPPIRGADGTGSLPYYTFSNDTNTGFYRISTDNIGVSTGGVLRATIGNANTIISTVTSLTNTTASTSTSTGALVVSGGAGISGNITTGGNLEVVGNVSGGSRSIRVFNRNQDGNNGDAVILLGGKESNGVPDTCWYMSANGLVNNFNVPFAIGFSPLPGPGVEGWYSQGTDDFIYLDSANPRHIRMLKQTRFADGNVTVPSISFVSDTNTGLYSSGSDNIAITTGGVQRVVIGNATTSLTANTVSTSATTGALVVSGGVGIAGNLNVGGVLTGSSAFADGNVTNPSIGFSNDTNTGIFRLGSDNIAISANGAVALNIASNSANTNSYADAGIFHRIPSYHIANAQLVFNYQSISISSTALNDTSATVLGSIAGNPLVTNIGFFSVSNNDAFVNAQQRYWIIFARASFQANSTGSRALLIIADNQTTWQDVPATSFNLGTQVQCIMHYYGSLAGGVKLSVVQNSGSSLNCFGHINIVRVA
jgi:hypothetical protein